MARNAKQLTLVTGIGWAALQTTTFNHTFVDFYASKRKVGRASSWISTASHQFYNAAVLVGLAGLCIIPVFLALQLLGNLHGLQVSHDSSASIVSSTSNAIAISRSAPTLLVPGVTTPLRDLPIVLGASFLAILFHELGHAMAAGLSGIPLISTGFLLVFIFPGAYVSLANERMDQLAPLQRLQIICSGVWHNFVLVLALWTFAASGISSPVFRGLFRGLGYHSTDERGVVLLHLAKTSPLVGMLDPGTVITHLDDFELHDPEHWDRYLLADSTSHLTQSEDLGWCLPLQELLQQSDSCCDLLLGNSSTKSQTSGRKDICFLSSGTEASPRPRGCLDPSIVLAKARCIEECPQAGDVCVRPAAQEQLLRLSISKPDTRSELEMPPASEVIFYQGDRVQLWRQARVGDLIPPKWLTLSLPNDVTLFFNYLRTISISLGMLNLLPLPRLDGGELLQVLLYAQVTALPRPNASLRRSQGWSTEDIVQKLLQSRIRRRLANRGRLVELLVSWVVGSLLATTVTLAVWREAISV